jgi:solute:Na+ symporter, SSS family
MSSKAIMDKVLFFTFFLLLGILYFLIGYWVSRSVKSVEDYYLADRNLGIFPLTISLIATQLGGGFILGTSEKAYQFGFYGLLYIFGICAGFLLLASGIAGKLRAFGVTTTAQIFELKYNSVLLKKIASIGSVLSLGGIFAAQVVGSKTLLTALDVYNPVVFIIFWLLIIIYTMLGGLRAIVKNDVVQLTLIIVVFVCFFIYDFWHAPVSAAQLLTLGSTLTTAHTGDWAHISTILLMPALYSLIEQDLAQTFFAARSVRIAVLGAFSAALFLLCFAGIPLYFGLKTKMLNIPVILQANPLMSYFSATYGSTALALITYGVFAAIISTANAVLCAVSGNLVQDFKLTYYDPRHKLLICQSATLLVGLIGLLVSFYYTDLLKLLVDSYAIPVTALLVPLLVAFYATGPLSRTAAYMSVVMGLAAFVISSMTGMVVIACALDALLISAVGYLIGFMLDYKKIII